MDKPLGFVLRDRVRVIASCKEPYLRGRVGTVTLLGPGDDRPYYLRWGAYWIKFDDGIPDTFVRADHLEPDNILEYMARHILETDDD